jgi:RimJ/RimL family protein N-acetyltransferase
MGEGPQRSRDSAWQDQVWLAKHSLAPEHAAWNLAIRNDAGEYLGKLTPIRLRDVEAAETCAALTRWRDKHSDKFLTQFKPTVERTRNWLTNVVLPDDTRILFLIQNAAGELVGNIGLCNLADRAVEVDNVLRGEERGPAGLVYFATVSLLEWAFHELEAEFAWLQVFRRNERAVCLYRRIGFVDAGCQPLWRTEVAGGIRLITEPVEGAIATDIELLRMELTREEFQQRFAWVGRYKEEMSWSH